MTIITREHEKKFREIIILREQLNQFENHHIYFDLRLDAMDCSITRMINEKLGKELLAKIQGESVAHSNP